MSDTAEERTGLVPDAADSLSLEEALGILGEETRARIITELGEARREDGVTPAILSFSELMERVGAEDSGRFNYHLDKLVGTFVKKTSVGYALRPPGHFVYRAIVTGALTDREGFEPFVVGECPDCGDDLVVNCPANQCIYVVCDTCETYATAMRLPNSGFADRSPEDALEVALRKNFHHTALAREGICHGCSSVVTGRLRVGEYETWDERLGYDEYAVLSCTRCTVSMVGHPACVAMTAPTVRVFFETHDRDVATVPPWSDPVVTARRETTVSDGETCTVPFELGDERLTVTLDADLQVLESRRERVEAAEP